MALSASGELNTSIAIRILFLSHDPTSKPSSKKTSKAHKPLLAISEASLEEIYSID